MALDKYSQLQIALSVHRQTLKEFGQEIDAHPHVIRRVCRDKDTSARISAAVEQKIKDADEIYQAHRKAKLATAQN